MATLQPVCPNIEELTEKEYLEYAYDSPYTVNKEARVRVIKLLYQIYGYQLEPELLLVLADETDRKMILAPAGGAKTTTLNIKLILEKIYRNSKLHPGQKISGENMLFLVYNRANVADVKGRHEELVNQLKLSGVGGVDKIDSKLDVMTMHAFCESILMQFAGKAEMVGWNKMSDEQKESLMKAALKAQIKKYEYEFSEEDVNIANLLSLYNIARETMIDYKEMEELDKFVDLGLELNFVNDVFNTYDLVKKRQRRYDFTDVLTKFYKLVTEHEEVLDVIKCNYEYFCVDECQDMTKIMSHITHLLSEGNPMTMIGDDDQCIYGFRGAECDNVLHYNDFYPDGRVFVLKTNRRCPKNIVELGEELVSHVHSRYGKKFRSVKPNGEIEMKGFLDRKGECLSIIKQIKAMSDEERSNTCICYRNRTNSSMIVDALIREEIHFNIISGVEPFSYKLFTAVMDVLRALNSKRNKKLLLNLYKILPIRKAEMAELLNWDLEKGKSKDGVEIIDFLTLDFGKFGRNQSTADVINYLKEVCRVMDTTPLVNYVGNIIMLIKQYYWDNTMRYLNIDPQEDIEFTKSVADYFSVKKTFPELLYSHEFAVKRINRDQMNKTGVTLATFHGLKGLEFDNVIIMDFTESVFPNSAFIDNKPYTEDMKIRLKDAETRLAYVAVTRAKKKLYIYYSKSDPSIYASYVMRKIRDMLQEIEKDPVKKIESFDDEGMKIESVVNEKEDLGKMVIKDVTGRKVDPNVLVEERTESEEKKKMEKVNFKKSVISRFFGN